MADSAYQTYSYRFLSKGLQCRYVLDSAPDGTFQNLDSLELREENSISSRFGLFPITTNLTTNFPLGAPGQIGSLGRMAGLDGNSWRYATALNGISWALYRRAGTGQGAFTDIGGGGASDQISMFPYRPAASSFPYMFFAVNDGDQMVKDNGSFSAAENWGINPPLQPALIEAGVAQTEIISSFDPNITPNSYNTANLTGVANQFLISGSLVGPFLPPTQLQTVAIGTTAISAFSRTSNVMTITAVGHNLKVGSRVMVANLPDAAGNVASAVITTAATNTFEYANIGPNNSGSGGATAFCTGMPNFQTGMLVYINDGSPESVYIDNIVPNFTTVNGVAINGITIEPSLTHSGSVIPVESEGIVGTIAANTLATISLNAPYNILNITSPYTDSPDTPLEDLISFFVYAENPMAILEIKIAFDVGDGSFTQDYYYKSVTPSDWTPSASGTIPTVQSQTQRVFGRAAGSVDVRQKGVTSPSLLPNDLPSLQSLQPMELNPGQTTWTQIVARLDEFNQVGNAGNPGQNWANVVGYQITIQTQPNLGTIVGVDDLLAVGGSGLDSFAGQPYDYRWTYYNINTGCESTPSVEMIQTSFVSVQRIPILVKFIQPTDPQVTHIRIYRRGGSLTQAWYFVTQVPVGTGNSYEDTYADSIIEVNPTLNIDADPPVTSVMQVPMNLTVLDTSTGPGLVTVNLTTFTNPQSPLAVGQLVTIGTSGTQEQVRVVTFGGSGGHAFFTAYLQYEHFAGEQVTATTIPNQSMNLFAIAFDQAFLAGDPNNPHVLYYSVTYSPETFPQENFIEVGTPDSPIMALVVLRGFLYVFTTKTVYQIFGGQGSTPVAIPTGVMHGLQAQFAWAASENVIYYLSYDGIYAFQGSGSAYMTRDTEWVWTGKNLGPVPAINTALKSQVVMAYANHELFVGYTDQNGNRHRQIYSDVYNRWRNDTAAVGNIFAMNFEQDTGDFVVGKDDGMVYLDRVNDYDSGGYSGGVEIKNAIPFTLQTAQLDQGVPKAFKVYNELTIDATLNGNTVNVFLIFDDGNTVLPMGTITGTTRQQYQLNINSGDGYNSKNIGVKLTGSVKTVCTFNEVHIRAVVNAEYRDSFDSWWMRFSTDEYKISKQGYFEYIAPDAGGITVDVYAEGNMAAPIYTFNLPQSTNRISKRVRFPARKRKLWRFVGTSESPFQMYMPESMIEVKSVSTQKGYERAKLQP
jgi:hypothetical protein